MSLNLERVNRELEGKSLEAIIAWAISLSENPVITTNFRPYEVAILNAVTAVKKDIKEEEDENQNIKYRLFIQNLNDPLQEIEKSKSLLTIEQLKIYIEENSKIDNK